MDQRSGYIVNKKRSKISNKKLKNYSLFSLLKEAFNEVNIIEENNKTSVYKYIFASTILILEVKKTDVFYAFRMINNFTFDDDDKKDLIGKNINKFNSRSSGIKAVPMETQEYGVSFRVESIVPSSMCNVEIDYLLITSSLAVGAPELFLKLIKDTVEQKEK